MKNFLKEKKAFTSGVISVIVPVYKVEEYLSRCIESILNQTYKNLQVILIDDGSPDNCGKICDEYAKLDSRVEVIHKTNGGLSDTRNFGLDVAQGEYIGFVDSDDYIEVQMYELMLNKMQEDHSDIVSCGICRRRDDKIVSVYNSYDTFESTGREGLKRALQGQIPVVAWNKIYSCHIFDEIRFPIGRIYEDEIVAPLVFEKATKVSYINNMLYNYTMREGSILNSGFSMSSFQLVEAIEWQKNTYEKDFPELKSMFNYKLYSNNEHIFIDAIRSHTDKKILKNIYINIRKYSMKSFKSLNFSGKLRVFIVCCGFMVYSNYIKIRVKNI